MLLEQVKETKQKKKFKEKPQWSISSSNNVLLENALVSSKDCQMILISKRLSDTLRNYGIDPSKPGDQWENNRLPEKNIQAN